MNRLESPANIRLIAYTPFDNHDQKHSHLLLRGKEESTRNPDAKVDVDNESDNQNPTKADKEGDETARKRGEMRKYPVNKLKVIGKKDSILRRLYIFAE